MSSLQQIRDKGRAGPAWNQGGGGGQGRDKGWGKRMAQIIKKKKEMNLDYTKMNE
jgi:hypothetical protein